MHNPNEVAHHGIIAKLLHHFCNDSLSVDVKPEGPLKLVSTIQKQDIFSLPSNFLRFCSPIDTSSESN